MSTDLVNRPNGIGVIDELRQQFPEIPERTVKELLERSPSREECVKQLAKISEDYLYGPAGPMPPDLPQGKEFRNGARDSGVSSQSSRSSTPDLFRNDSVVSGGRGSFSAGVTPENPVPPSSFARSNSAFILSQLPYSKDKPLISSAGAMMYNGTASNMYFKETTKLNDKFQSQVVLEEQNNCSTVIGVRNEPMGTQYSQMAQRPDNFVTRLSTPTASHAKQTNVAKTPSPIASSSELQMPSDADFRRGSRSPNVFSTAPSQRLLATSSADEIPVSLPGNRMSDPFIVPDIAWNLIRGSSAEHHVENDKTSVLHCFGSSEDGQYLRVLLQYQKLRLDKLKEDSNVKNTILKNLKGEIAVLREQMKRHHKRKDVIEPRAEDVRKLKEENEKLRYNCQILIQREELLSSSQVSVVASLQSPQHEYSPRTPPPRPPLPVSRPLPPPPPLDDSDKWECCECTLLNHPLLDKCEVCETPRVFPKMTR